MDVSLENDQWTGSDVSSVLKSKDIVLKQVSLLKVKSGHMSSSWVKVLNYLMVNVLQYEM